MAYRRKVDAPQAVDAAGSQNFTSEYSLLPETYAQEERLDRLRHTDHLSVGEDLRCFSCYSQDPKMARQSLHDFRPPYE
jgi:hypothetical protein